MNEKTLDMGIVRTAPVDWRRLLVATAFFAVLWFMLSGADVTSWSVGLPFVLAAGWLGTYLSASSPIRLRPLGVVRLIALLAVETLRATVDIGRRCLAPEVRFRAGLVKVQTRLTDSRALYAFAYAISIVPGTVTANVGAADITVHVLDLDGPWRDDLARMEDAIAGAFGLTDATVARVATA